MVGAMVLIAILAAGYGLLQQFAPGLAPAPPLQPLPLTIAVSPKYIGSGLVLVAQAKGYFAQQGLQVTLLPHTSGRDAQDAVLARQADIATVGDTPLTFAILARQPVTLVATIFKAGGAHAIVGRSDPKRPGDALQGRRVGVTLNSDSHFLLSVLLARQGHTLADVSLVPMPPQAMADALREGRVDAVSSWQPWVDAARQVLGEQGFLLQTERGFMFGFHLVGRSDWAASHQPELLRLMKALAQAEALFANQADEAHALLLQATGADPAMLRVPADRNGPSYRFTLTLDQSTLIMLEDQSSWATRNGLVPTGPMPNLLDHLSMDALLQVKPGGVTVIR